MTKKITKISIVAGALVLTLAIVGINSAAAEITLGALTATSDGALTLNAAAGSNVSLGTAAVGGAITIGGTGLQTGAITIGGGTGAQTVNVGTGGTGVKTINVGTGAIDNVVTMGTATGAASLSLLAGTGDIAITSVDDVAINGGSTGSIINMGTSAFAHVINIGVNAVGNTVNIGTGGTVANTIAIGTGAIGNGITIGSVTGAASLDLKYGTGALNVTPTPDTTLEQDELAFRVIPITGGGATEAKTFTGLRATAVVVCTSNEVTNAVTLSKVKPTANTLTFTYSADPGSASASCMIHNI